MAEFLIRFMRDKGRQDEAGEVVIDYEKKK